MGLPRLKREAKTVSAMVQIFCDEKNHFRRRRELCYQCAPLLQYALERLEHCIFAEDKPTCAKCPAHCYKKEMRKSMIDVMKFSGPKMIWKHPVLAIQHLLDGRKAVSEKVMAFAARKSAVATSMLNAAEEVGDL